MAVNSQYLPGETPFGMSAAIAQTGAPGSQGVTAAESAGPVIGSPVVSVPFASSQLPGSRPTLDVVSGDTCSSSADAPVPASGDPMTGLSLAQVTQTGSGLGSGHAVHPDSTARA